MVNHNYYKCINCGQIIKIFKGEIIPQEVECLIKSKKICHFRFHKIKTGVYQDQFK